MKLACVSFYKNLKQDLPPGSGIFVVMCAKTGAPLAIFQENRFMTDLRTGAAGAVAIQYTTSKDTQHTIGFIGCGAIARNMARAAAAVRPNFKGVALGNTAASAERFATEMQQELGLEFTTASSSSDLCQQSSIIFTQTPASQTVLEWGDLKPGTTVVASGSDQPTKQEIPNEVLQKCDKYVADLVKQTSKVGELRAPIQAGIMSEQDVYAELGELVNGTKPGRESDEEIIVVDLTGTGAQDAAIGQGKKAKCEQCFGVGEFTRTIPHGHYVFSSSCMGKAQVALNTTFPSANSQQKRKNVVGFVTKD